MLAEATRVRAAALGASLVLAGALAAGACGEAERPADPPAAAAPAPPIVTDSTSYTLAADSIGWGTKMMLRFQNPTEDTLYAVNCNGALTFALEREMASGWELVLAPMTNACLSPPITIAPGETFMTPWTVYGARPGGNAGPQFADTTFGGSYRLNWWNLRINYDLERPQLGDTVPLRDRVSNTFTLTRGADGRPSTP